MLSVWVENDKKEKIELTNSTHFESVLLDGLLPSKATLNYTTVANQDGGILQGVRGDVKNISFTIKPSFPVEENRHLLYKYFKVKKEVTIYIENESRDVMITGTVEAFDCSLFESKQTIIIDIVCFGRYFKDKQTTYKDMSTLIPAFEFPFSIDEVGVEFSYIDKVLTQNLYNAGDTDTGLIIELSANGEVVKPIIYNVDTKEYFGLKTTMQLGDVIRINTNTFNKTVELVRYGETRNIINDIMKGNKWFKLAPGDNQFTYSCESGEEFLKFKFIYQNLYEGV